MGPRDTGLRDHRTTGLLTTDYGPQTMVLRADWSEGALCGAKGIAPGGPVGGALYGFLGRKSAQAAGAEDGRWEMGDGRKYPGVGGEVSSGAERGAGGVVELASAFLGSA